MASNLAEVAALGLTYSVDETPSSFKTLGIVVKNKQDTMGFTDVCSCKVHDVIILAEFSEVKGPVPLLTIPIFWKNFLDVDLDEFILKIMSVDYQANSSGHFRFSNDTQVLQTDVVEGVHAYVHYFSLNDIVARGFVRPLCLAYISKNLHKLEAKVSILRDEFLKVSNSMKCDNRGLFLEEVSMGLLYLKDIQYNYFHWKLREDDIAGSSKEDDFMLNVNLDQLVDQQSEYSSILQSAKLVKESEEMRKVLSRWKSVFASTDDTDIENFMSFVKSNMVFVKPAILCLKSNVNESNLHQLRPIAAISPFGIAIGLWNLCRLHTHLDKCALEMVGGCFWNQNDMGLAVNVVDNTKLRTSLKREIFNALSDDVYRQLLMQLISSKVTSVSGNYQSDSLLNQESMEAIMFTSVNEASSSYYSDSESINDATAVYPAESVCHHLGNSCFFPSYKTRDSSGSSDSLSKLVVKGEKTKRDHQIVADDWSSDSSDCLEHSESKEFDFPASGLWFKCIWNGNLETLRAYPGPKILNFFQVFSKVAQHILYSFLIGRTVVIAGSSTICHKVLKLISAIIYFVPVQKDSKYLRWHKGILVTAHIEKYKIIGLCVPERLTVHDMISPHDKNSVTILDVNTKRIFGPAYSGVLLGSIGENFHDLFLSDESLVLFLQATFKRIKEKVFLYQAIVADGTSPNSKKSHQNTSSIDILHSISVKGCDADIVKYLRKLMARDSFF